MKVCLNSLQNAESQLTLLTLRWSSANTAWITVKVRLYCLEYALIAKINHYRIAINHYQIKTLKSTLSRMHYNFSINYFRFHSDNVFRFNRPLFDYATVEFGFSEQDFIFMPIFPLNKCLKGLKIASIVNSLFICRFILFAFLKV